MCNMVAYFCFTACSEALHFSVMENCMFVKISTSVFLRVVVWNCTSEYSVTYHVISFVRAANSNLNACHQPQVSLSLIAQYESVRANTHSLTSNRSLCCLHGFLTAGAHTTCTVHWRNMQPFFFTSPLGSSVHLRWLAGHTDPWHVRAGPVPPCPPSYWMGCCSMKAFMSSWPPYSLYEFISPGRRPGDVSFGCRVVIVWWHVYTLLILRVWVDSIWGSIFRFDERARRGESCY